MHIRWAGSVKHSDLSLSLAAAYLILFYVYMEGSTIVLSYFSLYFHVGSVCCSKG